MAKKITAFTLQNVAPVQADINAALGKIGERYGIKIELGRLGVSGSEFSGRLVATSPTGNEMERRMLQMRADSYGVDIDRTSADGYRIVGFNPRASSKPWEIEKDGKGYKASTDWILPRFRKAPAEASA